MQGFREQNRFLIYLVNFSGLYLTSIESLTDRKWLLYFLAGWTKIAIVLVPIYIGSVVKFLAFDEAPFTVKMAVFRRVFAFSCFFCKNIFFYIYRKRIEELVDLWDSFFTEEFYPEKREEKLKANQKRNKRILSLSWFLTILAPMMYTISPFFLNTKTLTHPSGIPYRHQSPDYELMLVYDLFRVNLGCTSAGALDCILMVFLSHILVQLTHLRDSLTEMVEGITLDADGRIIYKTTPNGGRGGRDVFYVNEISYGKENSLRGEEGLRLYQSKVEEFEVKMRIWILHHQQLIRFFEGVKSLFTPIASLQLIYVVFYTCFTAFHLVRAKIGIDAFVIPIVAVGNLISLFVWCFMGYQIEYTSSQLFGDAFGRCWFLFPRKVQRSFSFVVMRGWKPLMLRGISLFDLNLFTFYQVFKITYQLFAFLLQVAREE